MSADGAEAKRVNVRGCSGCGSDHDGLLFEHLAHPAMVRIGKQRYETEWMARCPKNRRKVYLLPNGGHGIGLKGGRMRRR